MRVVRVLGAGISGLTAAAVLSKNGVHVEVYERLPERVWRNIKKGVQAIRNYGIDYDVLDKFREMGVNFNSHYGIYREIRYSPSLRKVEIYSDNAPMFYCFPRYPSSSIDLELYEEAKAGGAEFFFGQTTDEADIIATGTRAGKIAGYGYHYYGVDCDSSIHLFLNNEYAPYGYIFMVPYKNNELTIGATCFNGILDFSLIKKMIDRFIEKNPVAKGYTRDAASIDALSSYAYYDNPDTAKVGGKMLIGEAAGFMDASRGFGLIYAIESGYLAAKSIIENADYNHMWKESFGKELARYFYRRQKYQSLENAEYEKMISGIIGHFGPRINVEEYARIKDN